MAGKAYPVPVRVSSFEDSFAVRDPQYNSPIGKTYAQELHEQFSPNIASANPATATHSTRLQNIKEVQSDGLMTENEGELDVPDVKASIESRAIEALKANQRLIQKIQSSTGASWGEIVYALQNALPNTLEDKNKFAYELTPKALITIFGQRNSGWHSFKNEENKTYVKSGAQTQI